MVCGQIGAGETEPYAAFSDSKSASVTRQASMRFVFRPESTSATPSTRAGTVSRVKPGSPVGCSFGDTPCWSTFPEPTTELTHARSSELHLIVPIVLRRRHRCRSRVEVDRSVQAQACNTCASSQRCGPPEEKCNRPLHDVRGSTRPSCSTDSMTTTCGCATAHGAPRTTGQRTAGPTPSGLVQRTARPGRARREVREVAIEEACRLDHHDEE